MKKISLVFMGTAEFAVPSLKALAQSELFNVLAVVTQPDRRAGRKKVLTPPPVKKTAVELGLPVLQPEKITEIHDQLAEFNADVFVVVAYGQILPKSILDIPEHGVINVHGSILPKYRGASPIQSAVLNQEKETGVTIMIMDEKMDHGDILKISTVDISKSETSETLTEKLSFLGANALLDTIPQYIEGSITPQPQDHSQATYTKKITKESGRIDWTKPAKGIEAMIRAYTPWPTAYTFDHHDNRIIIHEARVAKFSSKKDIGSFLINDKLRFGVVCGNNSVLEIKKAQKAGSHAMESRMFLNGVDYLQGDSFK